MKITLLSIFLLMLFRNFQYFPGMALVQEFWYGICLIFILLVYPLIKIKARWRFSSFEKYVLLLLCFIPLQSGIAAWLEFSQPVFLGILAQRGVVNLAGVLLAVYALRKKFLTLQDFGRTLIYLAWGTLTLYVLMTLTLDPSTFDGQPGFVVGDKSTPYSFVFLNFFIVFGLFYYLFLGFRNKLIIAYLKASFFLLYLLVISSGRSMLVAIFATFIFYVIQWGQGARLIRFLPKLVIIITSTLLLAYLINPETFSEKLGKFSDAFTVAFTGKEVLDVSANARIFEAQIAGLYIVKHPVLGNGTISHQWNGGYKGALGEYFHVSDIGIIGVVYNYGVMGLLLFLYQYKFAVKAAKETLTNVNNPIIDASKGMILYIALHSLATGIFVNYVEISLMFILLLVCEAELSLRYSKYYIQRHRSITLIFKGKAQHQM